MIRTLSSKPLSALVITACLALLPGTDSYVYAQEEEVITNESAPITETIKATPTPTPTPSVSPEPSDPAALPGIEDAPPPEISEPTEAPQATPIPTPVPAPKIDFIPPLSLSQCQSLIEKVKENLPTTEFDGDPPESSKLVPILDRMVSTCTNFLEYRNDLHSSLSHYRWIQTGKVKVQTSGEEIDHDVVKLDSPIKNVSAISFELEVEKADVWIYHIKVYDDQNQLVGNFLDPKKPKKLRHSLPRREVYHFWQPTTIDRVEIECSKATRNIDVVPRVKIYAGRTNKPEYIKSAIYFLSKAKTNLNENQWSQTRLNLIRAQEKINNRIKEDR